MALVYISQNQEWLEGTFYFNIEDENSVSAKTFISIYGVSEPLMDS